MVTGIPSHPRARETTARTNPGLLANRVPADAPNDRLAQRGSTRAHARTDKIKRVNAVRLQALKTLVREHKLFSAALAAGAFLRLITVLGYPGALWFAGDSYVYVGAALRPQPNLSKSTGYSLFLRALLPFHSFTLVTVVQHLLGLAVAVMRRRIRRWGGRRMPRNSSPSWNRGQEAALCENRIPSSARS